MVIDDDTNPVALRRLNGWARRAPVVSPEVYDLTGNDLVFYGFGDEVKNFDAIVHFERQIGNVRRHDRQISRTSWRYVVRRFWTRVQHVVVHFHARTHLHMFILLRRARGRACRDDARPQNYTALQKVSA